MHFPYNTVSIVKVKTWLNEVRLRAPFKVTMQQWPQVKRYEILQVPRVGTTLVLNGRSWPLAGIIRGSATLLALTWSIIPLWTPVGDPPGLCCASPTMGGWCGAYKYKFLARDSSSDRQLVATHSITLKPLFGSYKWSLIRDSKGPVVLGRKIDFDMVYLVCIFLERPLTTFHPTSLVCRKCILGWFKTKLRQA